MVESNYDILGIKEGTSDKEIRDAFRRLALRFHSDRGGQNEQFIRIKQAYEDLKAGKKYSDTPLERIRNTKVYADEAEADVRRKNLILGQQLSKDMKAAEEWAAALRRSNTTGTRMFGSKTLGEFELERTANGALSIKGNLMAGSLTYDGPVLMQGNITSPSWTREYRTVIRLTRGDFRFVDPVENKYRIENGARIVADSGDVVVGNVFGRKFRVDDPDGKVGVYTVREHRTHISAPRGKIVAENIVNTVRLDADTVIVLNVEDDVSITAREILFYGSKLTFDSVLELRQGGTIRFFERNYSIQGLSGDAVIRLENGKRIRLHDLKTKKIKDLPDGLVPDKAAYDKHTTMVGQGFTITYEMLDGLSGGGPAGGKRKGGRRGWASRLGL